MTPKKQQRANETYGTFGKMLHAHHVITPETCYDEFIPLRLNQLLVAAVLDVCPSEMHTFA